MKLFEILLKRNYGTTGTNGALYIDGKLQCRTIELPNKGNQTGVSCIPEGRYQLKKRNSINHGNHLILLKVPNRELILIHPANDALKELRGCIAPVTTITGDGLGSGSRAVFTPLVAKVYEAIDKGAAAFITISKA